MARVTTDERHYTAIAEAIRAKLQAQTRYRPAEMAGAIGSIIGRCPHADVFGGYALKALPMTWAATAVEKEE